MDGTAEIASKSVVHVPQRDVWQTMEAGKQQFRLCRVKVRDLGLTQSASYGRICMSARAMRLEQCPQITPFELVRHGMRLEDDGVLFIAMEPIVTMNGEYIVQLKGQGTFVARSNAYVDHKREFKPNDEFVFVMLA